MKWEVRTMRSGTSCFDRTVFKKTVCRFWPLWVGYFVIWLIALPLQGVMYLRLQANARPGLNDGYMENFASRTVPDMAGPALALAVIFGVIAAMAVFSHLYNARSANLYGSLPIRREGLFVTHYLAGLAFLLVPNLVIFLLVLLIEAIGGAVFLPALGFWLAVACGECLFFYSLSVFCGMFTGHILALPAFYGILNILAYGVMGLVYTVFRDFYYGFSGFGGGVSRVVDWLTPINKLGSYGTVDFWVTENGYEVFGLNIVAAYAGVAVLLAAASFLLYRVRRLESAGDVVSVRCMRPVFKYGVAFCAGMALGVATSLMLGGGEVALMASILIWGVAGCFAAQMLLDKSFRVFKKWRGAVAVAGVFVALFLVVGFDLTGYETRIPNPANVESVQVDTTDGVRLGDNGDSIWLDVTDQTQIGQLVDLHRAAVGQRDRRADGGTGRSMRVGLTYTLKGGATLSREYWVDLCPSEAEQEGAVAWAMERLHQNREFYWRVYEFDQLEAAIARGHRLDRAEFWHYDDEQGQLTAVAGYGDDARALLDAVEQDFRAGRIGVRAVTDEALFDYGEKDTLVFYANSSAGSVYGVEIALQDTASSTLAEMKRLEANLDGEPLRGAYESWLK